MNSKMSYKRIAIITEEQASEMEPGYFDDNGGDTDGQLYIVPAEDAPDGAEIIHGYEVEYSGEYAKVPGAFLDFCGWSSRGYAYTASVETAEAIAAEEEMKDA